MTNTEKSRALRPLRTALGSAFCLVAAFAQTPPAPQPPATPPTFGDFQQRVKQVVDLHKQTPKIRTTRDGQETAIRRSDLKRTIRQARSSAKPGDVFSPEITADFRRVIQAAFQGPGAPNVRKTIRQGEPLQGWHLKVNEDYPEHLPVTTIPPTLLLNLPQLPPEMEYRIIGHDFVLEDIQAHIIIDFIPGAIP